MRRKFNEEITFMLSRVSDGMWDEAGEL